MARPNKMALLLPLAVVAVVGMMIFPMPIALLDFLLMCNISLALCLLISTVYLREPAKFTSLPTILLLTTLFRLGLNIATTRQLLGYGEAPEVVIAFGNFVVGGSLVVGAVIFLIITIVQFLVIAKGAERIAEVAARFSLDAMPGKQMSIDADVRAGILSLQEAKQKRWELQQESKLYGALDGAMKFVKGDAIAGIVITLINICAGLILGVTYFDLPFAEALHRYTIFTIGDGLVSQIPAVLVAVAAGLAVTRVEAQNESLLGEDLINQLGREPQALATTGIVLLVLAAIPGLPHLPFIFSGLSFLGVSRVKGLLLNSAAQLEADANFEPKIISPIKISISSLLLPKIQAEKCFARNLQALRTKVFETWGVVIPEPQLDIRSNLAANHVEIYFNAMLYRSHEIENSNAPISDSACTAAILSDFATFIESSLAEFIDDNQTRILLDLHHPQCEDLITNLIPKQLSITALTTILRSLIEEKTPVRELRKILQTIAESLQTRDDAQIRPVIAGPKDLRLLPELQALAKNSITLRTHELLAEVRAALARSITTQVANGRTSLRVIALTPDFDHLITTVAVGQAPLLPENSEQIFQVIAENPTADLVLTGKYSRRYIYEMLAHQAIGLPVIALGELTRDVELEVIAQVKAPEQEVSAAEQPLASQQVVALRTFENTRHAA
ncbi:FHIPEP family type III secretion protein [bacterium]|nr:FHIPEP family type III secretion protein [bacterium]